MNDSKNLLVALALSVAVFLGYNYFFAPKPTGQSQDRPQTQMVDAAPALATAQGKKAIPSAFSSKADYWANQGSQKEKVIAIKTDAVQGRLNTKGGVFNDLTLRKFKTVQEAGAPDVDLFYPQGTPAPYYANFGWISDDARLKLPNQETIWSANGDTLTPQSPVTLTFENGAGLVFERTLSTDNTYMIQVAERVTNKTNKPINLYPYAMITQGGKNLKASDYMAYYVGPIGVINGTLKETPYDDLDSGNKQEETSTGGWIGFTSQYWLCAIIPDQQAPYTYEFRTAAPGHPTDGKFYQTIAKGGRITLAPGQTQNVSTHLYAGIKDITLLDAYEASLNVPKFDRAIDFGWFYIITKPLLYVLDFLHTYISNMGLCIIALTFLVKILFYPLANKSYRSMARMKLLQPKIQALQAQYQDDKMKLNQAMMALYKTEKVNPVSGCLPMLVQIPVFFGLYKVLFISIEMRHAPFFGWIHDLAAPDPTNLFTLFGLIPWSPPELLTLGIWPLILGLSMFLQQKMSPQPADPTQAKVMMFLPIMFTFLFARFPVGLVLYWTCNNVLTIAQQWYIARQASLAAATQKAKKAEKKARPVQVTPKKRKK